MPSIHPKIQLPLPVQGIRADLDDFHLPPDALRSTSYNWLLRDGKMVTRPGLTTFANDPGTARPTAAIFFRDVNNTSHLVHATDTNWWRYDSSTNTWDDISDAGLLWSAGTLAAPATFRVFNSGGDTYLLGTSLGPNNTPRAWDTTPTSNVFTLFGGSAPAAHCIAIVGDRVILGALQTNRQAIDVSAFQDHTSGWGVTQTAVLAETPGPIVTMQELGINQCAVYKTNSIYIVSATTGLAPLRFDLHTANISGPMSVRAVVPISSSVHAVFTEESELFFFDGVNYSRHPASPMIQSLFLLDASTTITGTGSLHGHYNRRYNELWWFYSRAGLESLGQTDAIVVNLNNNSVWKANFFDNAQIPITAAHYGQVFSSTTRRPVFYLANSSGQFYTMEGNQDVNTSINANLETGLSDLGDPTQAKTLEETEHYFANPTATETPSVNILTSESGSAPTISPNRSLVLSASSTGPYRLGHRATGGGKITSRFMGIRIRDTGLTSPLEYRGTSLTIVPRGNR